MKEQEIEIGDLVQLTGDAWWEEVKNKTVLITSLNNSYQPCFCDPIDCEKYYVGEEWEVTVVSKVYNP